MKFRTTFTICLFGFWLCFGLVLTQDKQSPLLSALVPRIKQENFELDPTGQTYTLFIRLPDGSTRVDNVELLAPNTPEQELHFIGTIDNIYPDGTSVTMYEAGKNGYTVKYKYHAYIPKSPFLGSFSLKSAAG